MRIVQPCVDLLYEEVELIVEGKSLVVFVFGSVGTC